MLGRRLDRYVTAFFVWHFVMCLAAALVLYIVIDTFAKLDEFAEHEDLLETVRWILTYHLYQIPVLIGQFLPIVTLIAGVICLARLARYNELNAMKASGLSMHRVLLPIYLCTLAIGALAAANQEFVVPDLEGRIRTVRLQALRSQEVYDKLYVFDEQTRTTVYIPRLENAALGYHVTGVEARPQQAPGAGSPGPSFLEAQAIWGADTLFLFLPVQGRPGEFARKALATEVEARDYVLPKTPTARLADGRPAYALTAKLGDKPYSVRFAHAVRLRRLRLLRGAESIGTYKGQDTAPPISLRAALWYDEACRAAIGDTAFGLKSLWLGVGQTYAQPSPDHREQVLYESDVILCGDPHSGEESRVPLGATPERLIRTNVDPSLNSFGYLRRLAREVPVLRQRILIVLHSRVAFPFASLVLLLVAIPLLFQQEGGRSTWLGIGMALIVSLLFYFSTYYCQILGQVRGGIFAGAPGLAAWVPITIFGAFGAYLLARMDT